ncbi:E3 ubiquitin-protein ligase COP1 isoform X1 [Prunus yedoensis var. nudiflora]|uniref:Ubiquinol oxidase n=1 Tax=Prunus yedoensis var. nudiflora TaxID=2094558 RepID=A0A314ZV62_PRUYE|nr:E3 ubiquitin-protein ligase COP1 isoform X1 [Prunus yedoensis var. nudiflora]
MAAATLSSSVFAISTSCSSSSLKARNFKNSACSSFCSQNRLPYNPISARPSISSGGPSESSSSSTFESWVIKCEQTINIFLTDTVIKILDTLYRDRDYARFFVLETIARVPYFAFMSVLHMYESFGWWRRADYLKVHFAESWNEMHHLLIMEELGGNAWWFDRFLAQHIAIFYYFMTAFMYTISPRMAYHFSECVEGHAFSTYDKFIKARGEDLKKLPAPEVAVKYYTSGDLYLFDEFQTSRPPNSRRPKIENLYDVFLNIRDDEAEHCKTMKACQTHGNLWSPHSRAEEEDDSPCVVPQTDCEVIFAMEDSSMGGALVPTVKACEHLPASATETASEEPDKDIMCPICMQIIKDAFLTACGHSFCYICILTHLRIKSDCPCCAHSLTTDLIFPNFLLDKWLKNALASRMAKTASPFEQLRRGLHQGCEMSIKELDGLLSLLEDKKRKMEQQESETSMEIMLGFLHCLKKQKFQELNEIEADLQYIKEDITAVERRRLALCSWEQESSIKLKMLAPGDQQQHSHGIVCSTQHVQAPMSCNDLLNKRSDVKAQAISKARQLNNDYGSSSDMQCMTTPGVASLARKRRVHSQFNHLQECYLQKRRNWYRQEEGGANTMNIEGYNPDLEEFQSVLTSFTQYSRMRVIAELRHGDLFHSANVVSSIEFDRDDELFATAGVSRCIKVFEFSSLFNQTLFLPECDGYEEHEKRAWSVDFSSIDPSMLVSGSDDCKVKIWCSKQEESVLNIDMKANICSVKYNPGSSFFVAVGSADHHVHYYDLRNISQPLRVFSGHRKAVSYVKFLSNNELASASTDSTLRLWDVKENLPLCTYRGHMNEKNFVGLAVNKEYIACGSETNEVFVYHKAVSKPMAWLRFGSSDLGENDDNTGSYFISAVCWKRDSPMLLTANSQGTIKVLLLAA